MVEMTVDGIGEKFNFVPEWSLHLYSWWQVDKLFFTVLSGVHEFQVNTILL